MQSKDGKKISNNKGIMYTLARSIFPIMVDFSPNVSEQVASFSRAALNQ